MIKKRNTPNNGTQKEIISKDGAPMAQIPPGEFQMGSYYGCENEEPVHTVYVDAFYIDKYEVTNAQYRRFVLATGHSEPEGSGYMDGKWLDGFKPWSDSRFSSDTHPVVCVSWYDAQAYASWAGKRLPTEAEWEKAARGGLVGMEYPWGNERTEENANYGSCIGHTTPVGNYPPNDYGLYDMAGNVWEWCADWYDRNYYSHSPRSNPQGADSGSYRVVRGGGWSRHPCSIEVATRLYYIPSIKCDYIGFRCVRDFKQ